ncbi:replicative DNA helicase [Campylobacter gracilis]|uniref:Replicative DNA helicase n=1 Tax=Campylobacter gracilis RM3268 TaxID=553220 RepID=C8PIV4_9BACT|nr:replicative DNA helicase [Campylobacter gracilis]AKT92433.1 replicative DNA helicase [Campylobacter gracilis]EEV16859.1 replicative DNA helicase [Campylobacter gracilis RM3268]UEB45387.1 replicative DNA helicase [Campylobacter gracilis]SUW81948.1 replicative DNA helicase [Campylobacter gracilis]
MATKQNMPANLYDLDMERAILSSLLQNEDAYGELSEIISVGDFFYKPHADIYEAIVKCSSHNEPIAPSFVKKWLAERYDDGAFTEVVATSGVVDAPKYALELREKSIKRSLIKVAHEIPSMVNEAVRSKDTADKISSKIYELIDEERHGGIKKSHEIIADVVEELKRQKALAGSELVGLDTGFRFLNDCTKGLKPGELIIIAARPGMGKTAFALNLMMKTLQSGKGVVFFSLEMPSVQLMYRILSALSSIPLSDIMSAKLSDDDWTRFNDACDAVLNMPLFVYDSGYVNIHQVRTQLRKLKAADTNIELCVIDYIGLMTSTSNYSERHLQIAEISRGLKLLARELNIPIIALSQLNRSLEARSNKRPMLSDLRESGAIEQDADIILFVYRDEVYKEQMERERISRLEAEGKDAGEPVFRRNDYQEKAEIIVGKNRSGEAGRTIEVGFQGRFTRFVDTSFGGEPSESAIFNENDNLDYVSQLQDQGFEEPATPRLDAAQNLQQNLTQNFNEAQNSGVSLNTSSAGARNPGVNIDFDEMPSFGESGEQDGEEIDGESKLSAEQGLAEVRRAAQDAPQKQEFNGQNLDDAIAGGVSPQTERMRGNSAERNVKSAEGAKDARQDTKGASQGVSNILREGGAHVEDNDSNENDKPPFEAQEDEAKFKPARPLNIEEMGIPKINEANRLDDDDAPLDL